MCLYKYAGGQQLSHFKLQSMYHTVLTKAVASALSKKLIITFLFIYVFIYVCIHRCCCADPSS